jgi:hypothetical protein
MEKIINLLRENGPLTGKELLEKTMDDAFSVWRTCKRSEKIITSIIGNRYLRLDKNVKGYARLSPSILREFLTYTVVGLDIDIENIKIKAKALSEKIFMISREKYKISKEIISRIVKAQKNRKEIITKSVFIIAGDIVYNMAHRDPRPETSTGIMANGSDLDIIIVTENLSKDIIKELDLSIYHEKYYLLKMPAYHEEIDYIIKDIKRVEKQSDFNRFEFMVASKILCEGELLCGSTRLFESIKKLLAEKKIPQKLNELENIAISARQKAESLLLNGSDSHLDDEYKNLFYTTEEKEEIF